MMDTDNRTATRAVRLFEAFARVQEPQTLSEIAKRIDSPLSTCHSLVKALQASGYLYSSSASRRLYPTKRLLRLAQAISSKDPVVTYFEKAMTELRDLTQETVILGARQKDAVIYLEVVESESVIRYSARPGDLKPFHSSALGKMILGEMDTGEVSAILDRLKLDRVTDNTLTDPKKVIEDLTRSRQTGVYMTQGENVSEVMALAAPARVAGEIYGLVVAGPIHRMSDNVEGISEKLLQTCAAIEASFAG